MPPASTAPTVTKPPIPSNEQSDGEDAPGEPDVNMDAETLPHFPTNDSPGKPLRRTVPQASPKRRTEPFGTGNEREKPCVRCVARGERCVDALDDKGRVRKMCCECARLHVTCRPQDETSPNRAGQKRGAAAPASDAPLPKKPRSQAPDVVAHNVSVGADGETSGDTSAQGVRRTARKHVEKKQWFPSMSAPARRRRAASNRVTPPLQKPVGSSSVPIGGLPTPGPTSPTVEVLIVRRRRGRPPKEKSNVQTENTGDTSVIAPSTVDRAPNGAQVTATPSTVPPRRRGRPHGIPANSSGSPQVPAPSESDSTSNAASTSTPAVPAFPALNSDPSVLAYVQSLGVKLDKLSKELGEHRRDMDARYTQLHAQILSTMTVNASTLQAHSTAIEVYRGDLMKTHAAVKEAVDQLKGTEDR